MGAHACSRTTAPRGADFKSSIMPCMPHCNLGHQAAAQCEDRKGPEVGCDWRELTIGTSLAMSAKGLRPSSNHSSGDCMHIVIQLKSLPPTMQACHRFHGRYFVVSLRTCKHALRLMQCVNKHQSCVNREVVHISIEKAMSQRLQMVPAEQHTHLTAAPFGENPGPLLTHADGQSQVQQHFMLQLAKGPCLMSKGGLQYCFSLNIRIEMAKPSGS